MAAITPQKSSPRFGKLLKMLSKFNKDPEFRKGVREFVEYHAG